MDSTKYSRTVADMQTAGVNPALAMSGGVTTQATSNAQARAADVAAPQLELSQVAELAMQARQLKIQEKLADSQARKNNAEAENTEISNEYADEFNRLKNEGQEALNNLTVEQKNQVIKNIDKIDSEVELLKKQSATEDERKNLVMADAALKRSMKDKTEAEKLQIVEMLPFQKSLAEAQTENQKAQASLNLINAMYQKGLIDNGYIDELCRNLKADADTAESFAAVNEIKNAVKSGNLKKVGAEIMSEFKAGNYGSAVMKGLIVGGTALKEMVNIVLPGKDSAEGLVKTVSTMNSGVGNPGRTVVKGLGK